MKNMKMKNIKNILIFILIILILFIFYNIINSVYKKIYLKQYKNNKETILDVQKKLFSLFNIDSSINSDKTIITTNTPITEDVFKQLSFVTNYPKYNKIPMNLIGINVFLNGSSKSTKIKGLFDIVKKQIEISDKKAFLSKKDIHYPFLNRFINGKTIGIIVDDLLKSQNSNLVNSTKTFQLILDPQAIPCGNTPKNPDPKKYVCSCHGATSIRITNKNGNWDCIRPKICNGTTVDPNCTCYGGFDSQKIKDANGNDNCGQFIWTKTVKTCKSNETSYIGDFCGGLFFSGDCCEGQCLGNKCVKLDQPYVQGTYGRTVAVIGDPCTNRKCIQGTCINGFCQNETAKVGEACEGLTGRKCGADAECKLGTCMIPGVSLGNLCSADIKCRPGQGQCIDGTCTSTESPPGGKCGKWNNVDFTCISGDCYIGPGSKVGMCVEETDGLGLACKRTSGCKTGECIDGTCRLRNVGIGQWCGKTINNVDIGCRVGQCIDNNCKDVSIDLPLKSPCTKYDKCKFGECIGGFCQLPSIKGENLVCGPNFSCKKGLDCYNGICLQSPPQLIDSNTTGIINKCFTKNGNKRSCEYPKKLDPCDITIDKDNKLECNSLDNCNCKTSISTEGKKGGI